MLILMLPESKLLHYFSVERATDAETVVDADETSHRFELQPANVARAVATQFPIIDQGKVYCRHRWDRIITPRTDYVVLPYDTNMKTTLAIFILFVLAALGIQTRSFSRVMLLEEKGETSASVSVGDLNGDGLTDIVLAKGRHWPLHDRVLLND